jgi:hypothetical protein
MSDRLTDLFVKCPACETVNRLVTTPLPENQPVSCSQCGAHIGEVGTLAAAGNRRWTYPGRHTFTARLASPVTLPHCGAGPLRWGGPLPSRPLLTTLILYRN